MTNRQASRQRNGQTDLDKVGFGGEGELPEESLLLSHSGEGWVPVRVHLCVVGQEEEDRMEPLQLREVG